MAVGSLAAPTRQDKTRQEKRREEKRRELRGSCMHGTLGALRATPDRPTEEFGFDSRSAGRVASRAVIVIEIFTILCGLVFCRETGFSTKGCTMYIGELVALGCSIAMAAFLPSESELYGVVAMARFTMRCNYTLTVRYVCCIIYYILFYKFESTETDTRAACRHLRALVFVLNELLRVLTYGAELAIELASVSQPMAIEMARTYNTLRRPDPLRACTLLNSTRLDSIVPPFHSRSIVHALICSMRCDDEQYMRKKLAGHHDHVRYVE